MLGSNGIPGACLASTRKNSKARNVLPICRPPSLVQERAKTVKWVQKLHLLGEFSKRGTLHTSILFYNFAPRTRQSHILNSCIQACFLCISHIVHTWNEWNDSSLPILLRCSYFNTNLPDIFSYTNNIQIICVYNNKY